MIITKATYGGVDCKDILNSKIKNNRLIIRSDNDIVGDPSVGIKKILEVEGIHNGVYFSKSAEEQTTFLYPDKNTSKRKLGIFYSNNNENNLNPAIYKSLESIKKSSENVADIITCTWNTIPIELNPFYQINSWYKSRSHLNQLLQIMQCLYEAKEIGEYEYVSFLEHDVLYPEGYFNYQDFEKGTMITNMNYGGLCKQGWQERNQNDKPFHQMTMRFDDAIEHCLNILPNALRTNSGMIEPSKLISNEWYCENQAIHVNHGNHFTSHNSIYCKIDIKYDHPYWGSCNDYNNLF